MKMCKYFFFLVFLAGMIIPTKNNAYSDDYSNAIMAEMIKRAGEEGKMILLEFYADWCTQCNWMQKTVFQDKEVESILSTNYIMKKVNIDDLEGFELKGIYEVKVLPTILLFDTNGKMIERIEKTISPGGLIELLELHDNHRNKVKIKHSINTSPNDHQTASNETKYLQETYLKFVESTNSTIRNYRLQLGLFENFENAFEKVEKLKSIFLEPIIVVNDYKDDKVRYKVMMGEFSTLSEAESFRKILNKEYKLDAIIN